MGFPLIAYANVADTAVFSGGSWRPTLPLSNLGTRQYGQLARSSSPDPLATWFDVDIGVAGNLTRVVGLLNHNLTLTAQYRLRGAADPAFSDTRVNTGWLDVWPAVYSPTQVEWESDNFWLGKYTPAEINGYPQHLIILLGASKGLRYWRLELSDAANPAGYVQAGRAFLGDAWQPINSIAYGCSLGWEDPTTITQALSGADYPDPKAPYRVAKVQTQFMDDDEAYSKAFEIQRRSGTWKEVVYIHDQDDTLLALRRRFPGRLRTLSSVENPYPDANQAAWEIKELLP